MCDAPSVADTTELAVVSNVSIKRNGKKTTTVTSSRN